MVSDVGVVFPADESGKRSSLGVNQAIWADAVRGVAPELATRIEASRACAYCTIPSIRGPYVSQLLSTIVAEAIGAVPFTQAADLEFACKAGSEAVVMGIGIASA
mgnify:CR=1 FL=1